MYRSRLREGGRGEGESTAPKESIKGGGGCRKLTASEGRLLIDHRAYGGLGKLYHDTTKISEPPPLLSLSWRATYTIKERDSFHPTFPTLSSLPVQ